MPGNGSSCILAFDSFMPKYEHGMARHGAGRHGTAWHVRAERFGVVLLGKGTRRSMASTRTTSSGLSLEARRHCLSGFPFFV